MRTSVVEIDGADGSSGHAWVPAEPFRAHLEHLSAATGVPWPVLAVLARVSLPAARSLLTGRRGRPLRRLCPIVADRLLRLSTMRVHQAAVRQVPADHTVLVLRRLVEHSDLASIARQGGLGENDLSPLLRPVPPTRCAELVAATIEAAYRLEWSARVFPALTGTTTDLLRAA